MNHITIVRIASAILFLAGTLFSQDRFTGADSVVIIDLLAPRVPITSAVILQTGETNTHRWISVSMGDQDSSFIPLYPHFASDGKRGSFSVEFVGFDQNAYLESKWQRVYGKYPLQYEVEFVDSMRIKIKGRTLPFAGMECSYSFSRHEYRIEFNFGALNVTGSLPDSRGGHKIGDAGFGETSGETAKHTFEVSQGRRSARLMPLLYNSMYIAAGAVFLVFTILIGIQVYKRMKARKSNPNFADLLDAKSPPVLQETPPVLEEPEILTPEMREEKIRAMMASETISYDEAALRVQYESMK